MNFFDSFYNVLFLPNQSFSEIFKQRNFIHSFFILFLVITLDAVSSSSDISLLSLNLVFNFFTLFSFWIVLSMVLNFTSDLFGGTGKVSDTMTAVAYSFLPFIFQAPVYALSSALGFKFIYQGFNVGIFVWFLYLLTVALKNAHKYHTSSAVFSVVSILGVILGAFVSVMAITILGVIIIAQNF